MKGIIAVSGLPGSGKSFFASRLAKELNAGYLSSDLIRKEIFKNRSYSEKEKGVVYDEMVNRMNNLGNKEWVVVDATFHKKDNRAKVEEVARKRGVKFFWIMVTASEDIIKERLTMPRPDSDADFEVYKKIKESFESFQEPLLVLSSDKQSVETLILESLAYIDNER